MNPFLRDSVKSLAPESMFKSTEIWDEIVYSFCLGMPVKTHRKFLRAYHDSFLAKHAVDWIHDYLLISPYFIRHQVSRFQAVKLLRKFVQWDIIKRSDMKEGSEYDFQDNNDLYTFTKCVSEQMPLEPRQSTSSLPNGSTSSLPNESTSSLPDLSTVCLPNLSMASLPRQSTNASLVQSQVMSPAASCCSLSRRETVRQPFKPIQNNASLAKKPIQNNASLAKKPIQNNASLARKPIQNNASQARVRKVTEEGFWL